MTLKVAFISVDWSRSALLTTGTPAPGGAGYYRCALPAAAINEFGGGDIVAGHFPNFVLNKKSGEIIPIGWGNEQYDGWDIIVLQRWMHEAGPTVIRYARAAGQVVINDIDDWYWGMATTNAAFASSHPRPGALAQGKNRSSMRAERRSTIGRGATLTTHEITENRSHYAATLAASDLITTSTPYLAKRLEVFGPPVAVLRNMIDLRLWTRWPTTDSDHPMVGWVGATPWRSGDLETLRGTLPDFMVRHGLHFQHSGHAWFGEQAAVQLGLPAAMTCVVNMDSIDRYPGILEGIEVGLVPLKDTPFNRAKSAIKGMEYSAAGIPFIAQALDAYTEYGAGIVANRSREWTRGLERLVDPAERSVMSDSQYERVQAEDASVRWADWAKLYRYAAGAKTSPCAADNSRLLVELAKLADKERHRQSEQARMASTARHW